jgi:hypothetical protein
MPLDTAETIALADEVYDLGQEIAQALRRDDDGRVRLTRRERRKIAFAALRLAVVLLRDLMD